jgi:hypothetical protein
MARPDQNAITPDASRRRDENLARTRRLSVAIATVATAASIGLTVALGTALPGHTASTAGQPSPGTTAGAGTGGAGTTGTGGTSAGGAGAGGAGHHRGPRAGRSHKRGLAPPAQAPTPAPSTTKPAVSSGGS